MGTFQTKILQKTLRNRTDQTNCLQDLIVPITEHLILPTFSTLTLLCHNLTNSIPSIVGNLHVSNTIFLDHQWYFVTYLTHTVHKKSYSLKAKDFLV